MEAVEMKIEIKTDDGTCPVYVFGSGPAALMYMDGIG